jgi:hypothetical protein
VCKPVDSNPIGRHGLERQPWWRTGGNLDKHTDRIGVVRIDTRRRRALERQVGAGHVHGFCGSIAERDATDPDLEDLFAGRAALDSDTDKSWRNSLHDGEATGGAVPGVGFSVEQQPGVVGSFEGVQDGADEVTVERHGVHASKGRD